MPTEKNKSGQPRNSGRPWTPDEIEYIAAAAAGGAGRRRIAWEMGRTLAEIREAEAEYDLTISP